MREKANFIKWFFVVSTLQLVLFSITKGQNVFDEVEQKYGGGKGEPNNPYLIYTPEQMNTIGTEPNDWNKHFKLMADIDLAQFTGTQFNIIGTSYSNAFTGVFNGNGKTITNFSYASIDRNYIGLFGYVGRLGTDSLIQDIKLVDPNINAGTGCNVGALIGHVRNATVTNSWVEGGKVYGEDSVGGLIGYGYDSSISSCYSDVSVQGIESIGGVVGKVMRMTFEQCHSKAHVTGNRYIGGLLGRGSGEINLCYSAGSVSGEQSIGGLVGYNFTTINSSYSTAIVVGTDEYVGGLIGYNYGPISSCKATGVIQGNNFVGGFSGGNSSTIKFCYAIGTVQGNRYVAGFVGSNDASVQFSYSTGQVVGNESVAGFTNGGSVFLCYWDTETSGVEESKGGKGKTTAQMQSASTYRGWGYDSQWVIDEANDYPRLIWEGAPGELLVDFPRSYNGGTGDPNNPYQINSAEQFASIAYYLEDYDNYFILTDNLDFSTINQNDITPIGNRIFPFSGSINGNNYVISNLVYHAEEQSYIGLLGYISAQGLIENIQLFDISFTGSTYIGGIAGYNRGTIQNCSITGTVNGGALVGSIAGSNYGPINNCSFSGTIEGNSRLGGLVGYNEGKVIECSSHGEVIGDLDIGGLIGHNRYANIVSCYSNSIVEGEENVGGLIGLNNSRSFAFGRAGPPPGFMKIKELSHISSCYCTGSVEGHECVGGLIGNNIGLVEFCYSASQVIGIVNQRIGRGGPYNEEPVSIGGLIGDNSYGVVLLSYWDTEASGIYESAGGKGKTTEQMMDAQTFSGWSYLNKWIIDDGNDYPHLIWEGSEGELIIEDYERYSGGTGEPNDPYIIDIAEDFVDMMYNPSDWDKYFILTHEINMNNVDTNQILPIGVFGKPFSGIFDGNNHTISNYEYLSETESYVGIFGSIGQGIYYSEQEPTIIGPNSLVLNLNVEDVNICGYCYIGGLVGYNDGQIHNCSLTGDVNCIYEDAGGLVGYNIGEIRDCNTQCNIIAERIVGGFVGYNEGQIINCRSSGNIGKGSETYVGGLIGVNGEVVEFCQFSGNVMGEGRTGGLIGQNFGEIFDCSAEGNITGTIDTGGLIGFNEARISGSFSNCIVVGKDNVGGLAGYSYNKIINSYATGIVEGEEYVAGLVGAGGNREVSYCYSSCIVTGQENTFGFLGHAYSHSEITSCFWDTSVSNLFDGAGSLDPDPEGVLGLSTTQMQIQSTFTDVGWDFVGETENGDEDIWWIDEGLDYPRLWWESVQIEE